MRQPQAILARQRSGDRITLLGAIAHDLRPQQRAQQ
jgi:hypothetical protein